MVSACGLSLSACNHVEKHGGEARPAAPAEVRPVSFSAVAETSTFVGLLKSRKSVSIRPRVEGHITEIFVRSGDVVKAGSRLLEIDPSKERQAVDTTVATYESNRDEKRNTEEKLISLKADRMVKVANLDFAKSQYERYSGLRREGAVAQESVDQYLNNYKAAQAELRSIDAQIKGQQSVIDKADKMLSQSAAQTRLESVQLGFHTVVAPFSGIVGDVPVKLGQYVTSTSDLTTIDQVRPLEIYIYVPAEQAVRLRKGLTVAMYDSGGEEIGHCPISFVSPQVSDQNQSVLVKAIYANADERLRSNQQVTAKIVWENKQRLMVPTNAVVHISGQDFIFTAVTASGGQCTVKQKPVVLGDIVDNSYLVKGGLSATDKIVVSDVQNLYDGARIDPKSLHNEALSAGSSNAAGN
ncbi:MAG: efflux RND transporter periplasmic adaptor subunit [Cyanobacteria bacterium REEB67]|nr:efflux RND transporter periplasmic adaptor subunit [Cyanobacteria bacterium REEB67]